MHRWDKAVFKSVRMDLWKIIIIHDTYEDGDWDNGLVVEDKRAYAKLLKFFQPDYRKVPDVSYVRWLNRNELEISFACVARVHETLSISALRY